MYREQFKKSREDHAVKISLDMALTPADQTKEWAQHKIRSNSSTYADRTKASKIMLLDSYPGLPLDDTEFVREVIQKSKGRLLKEHTLAWLCQHPEIAQHIDAQSWEFQLGKAFIWLPGIKNESVKVHCLTTARIMQIAQLEEYRETTPEVVFTAEWARDHCDTLNRLFRLQIKPENTNIEIVNKLLRKVAYRPVSTHKEGPRGAQVCIWGFKTDQDVNRGVIWTTLDNRWAGLLAENANNQVQATVSVICNKEDPILQNEPTGLESPIDKGNGRSELRVGDTVRWGLQTEIWKIAGFKGSDAILEQVLGDIPGLKFKISIGLLSRV